MRVIPLTAGLVLALATIAGAEAKESNLCRVVCSPAPAAKPAAPKPAPAPVRPAPPRPVLHRTVHRLPHRPLHRYARHHDEGGYYNYRETETVASETHGVWQPAPNDAVIPGPVMAYGPPPPPAYYPPPAPPCDCGQSVHIDESSFTGGVGYGASGGGFMDGYGVMHYSSGFAASASYNGYSQGFGRVMPGPFQPRAMGGFGHR